MLAKWEDKPSTTRPGLLRMSRTNAPRALGAPPWRHVPRSPVHGVGAEPVDAFGNGDPGDLEEPVTVGIGLDHGQEFPLAADEAAEFAEVAGEGGPAGP